MNKISSEFKSATAEENEFQSANSFSGFIKNGMKKKHKRSHKPKGEHKPIVETTKEEVVKQADGLYSAVGNMGSKLPKAVKIMGVIAGIGIAIYAGSKIYKHFKK